MILYKNYFITNGAGENDVSALNAFDVALFDAEISEANLVPVSSILPEKSKELSTRSSIKIGEIVHCVMARENGLKNERISAGVACIRGHARGKNYGLVMEAHGHVSREELKRDIEGRVKSMCRLRDFVIDNQKIIIKEIQRINSNFGCVIVAVIYR